MKTANRINHDGKHRAKAADVPPQDLDAERAVLGSLLLCGDVYAEVAPILSESDFCRGAHRICFRGICELLGNGTAVDAVTLADWLVSQGQLEEIGGPEYLHEILETVPHAAHAEYYARIVQKHSARRAVQQRIRETQFKLADPLIEVDEIIGGMDMSDLLDKARPERFAWLSAEDLAGGEYEQTYLIDGVLAAGVAGIVAGMFKALKTLITLSAHLSLATSLPFLGKFPVRCGAVPTAFMSGESGLAALKNAAERIARSMGGDLKDIRNFWITADLPRLDSPGDIAAVEKYIRERELKLLSIDPAYLCCDIADDAGNLFAMAKFLKPVGELCQRTGCTILMVHHCKRGGTFGEPAELADVAWSGWAEFAAQWLLLSRRTKFDPDTGRHELWLNVGGRAGHSGLFAANITEGSEKDIGGRVWEPSIVSASEARQTEMTRTATEKARQTSEKTKAQQAEDRERVVKAFRKSPDGETLSVIAASCSMAHGRIRPIIEQLLDETRIEPCMVKRANKREYEGFRLRDEPIESDDDSF